MMNLLQSLYRLTTPPKRVFDDYFDEARYILSYKICLFLIFSLSILSVVLYFFYGPIYSIVTFTGFIGVLVSFLFIHRTGHHERFALWFNLFGGVLCLLTLFAIDDQPHISDGLWMIINIIFAFNTISKKWASFIAIVHGLSFSGFFLFNYNHQIHLIKYLNHEQIVGTAINVLICFFIIFFLCWQNVKTTQYAQRQLNDAKTVLQNQYDIINKQNIEKTAMLKEIHHRVKNNLQVIISLLRLQSRELENEEAILKFRDTTSRVLAMALIHEKMYQSEELSKINLDDYFNILINDIKESYQVEFSVKANIECKVDNLGMKLIVHIALNFNELFSNSLKYAFESKEHAEINLKIIERTDKVFCLEYSDNGKWKTPERKDSFGLELIHILTEQIDGVLEFSHTPITKYTIYFNNILN